VSEFRSKWEDFPQERPSSGVPKVPQGGSGTYGTAIVERSSGKKVGDGLGPPLDRPPQTEQELRRLIDHLADPEVFAAWFKWAMECTDPAEGLEESKPGS